MLRARHVVCWNESSPTLPRMSNAPSQHGPRPRRCQRPRRRRVLHVATTQTPTCRVASNGSASGKPSRRRSKRTDVILGERSAVPSMSVRGPKTDLEVLDFSRGTKYRELKRSLRARMRETSASAKTQRTIDHVPERWPSFRCPRNRPRLRRWWRPPWSRRPDLRRFSSSS